MIARRLGAALAAATLLCSCAAHNESASSPSSQESAKTAAAQDAKLPAGDSFFPTPTASPPVPVSELPTLGVQYNGTWSIYDDAARGRVLDRLSAAGVKWVRIDVSWATLQPHPGGYDMQWGVPFIDHVLAQARAKGFKILVTFWQAPKWANGSDNVDAPPRDPRQFAAAAGWAANRWKSSVDAWEIWNEPNFNGYFVGANPATYTRLLCDTYPAVKKADPNSPVVFGGLMYNDDGWLKRAYAAGAHGCFDVLGTHPFQGPSKAPPSTPDDGNVWNLTHTPAVHNVMVAHGDGAKPIWFTEFGWSSAQPANAKPWNTGVSEQTQAAYLTQAVEITARKYPYVKAMFWFRDSDQSTGNAHEDHFGLLRKNLTPKPALAAMKALTPR
ncbi:cellulase family glycosylhydrolase [Dermatophilaceae bacterium Sec6.4]